MITIKMSFCPHNITQLQCFEDCLWWNGPNNMRSVPECQGHNYLQFSWRHQKTAAIQRIKEIKNSSKHNMAQQAHTRMFGIQVCHAISSKYSNKKNIQWPSMMQSYPPRALDRRLQEDWTKDVGEGLRVLMSLRVDFGLMG